MNLKRIAIAGLATAGIVAGGAMLGSSPASADTVPADPTYGSWPVLKQGQTSENVRALQWFLNCETFKVKTPSHFGPATYAQVKNFQAHAEMSDVPDGNVGAHTWLALTEKFSKPMDYGNRNDCVKAVQVLLNKWRYNDDLPITGYHGDRTKNKILRFQDAHGLPANGKVDTRTLHKLISTPAGK